VDSATASVLTRCVLYIDSHSTQYGSCDVGNTLPASSGERLGFEKLAEILEQTEQVVGVAW
jgi:hypothetical protein